MPRLLARRAAVLAASVSIGSPVARARELLRRAFWAALGAPFALVSIVLGVGKNGKL